MIIVYLAHSGSRVEIPDAVDLRPGEDENEVTFVDAAGHVLVKFQRADLALYERDGATSPIADGDVAPAK